MKSSTNLSFISVGPFRNFGDTTPDDDDDDDEEDRIDDAHNQADDLKTHFPVISTIPSIVISQEFWRCN